jgi:hypothetical protein
MQFAAVLIHRMPVEEVCHPGMPVASIRTSADEVCHPCAVQAQLLWIHRTQMVEVVAIPMPSCQLADLTPGDLGKGPCMPCRCAIRQSFQEESRKQSDKAASFARCCGSECLRGKGAIPSA